MSNRIIEEIKIAENKMKSLAGSSSGHIDIGYVFPLAKSYIPGLLKFLKSTRKIPRDHVFSKSRDHKKSDCGSEKQKNMMSFLVLVADEPEIEFVPVVNQEMVIITPPEHPLKYKKKLVLEDLLDYPVIGYDKTSGLGRFTNSIYKQNHIKPSIAFESSDENAIASLVAEDFGIGFVAHVESLQAYDVEITILVM